MALIKEQPKPLHMVLIGMCAGRLICELPFVFVENDGAELAIRAQGCFITFVILAVMLSRRNLGLVVLLPLGDIGIRILWAMNLWRIFQRGEESGIMRSGSADAYIMDILPSMLLPQLFFWLAVALLLSWPHLHFLYLRGLSGKSSGNVHAP